MKKYTISQSKKFKRSLKRYKYNSLVIKEMRYVAALFIEGSYIPRKYKDHKLKGNMAGMRELDIKPDCLLIYTRDKDNREIVLIDIGLHSTLFI